MGLLRKPDLVRDRKLLTRSLWLYTLYRLAVTLLLALQIPSFRGPLPPERAILLYGTTVLAAVLLQLTWKDRLLLPASLHLLADLLLLVVIEDPTLYPLLVAFFSLHAALFFPPLWGLAMLLLLLALNLREGDRLLLANAASLLLFGLLTLLIRRLVGHQQKAEEALFALEEIFPAIVQHSPQGVIVLRDEDVLFLNPQAMKLLKLNTPPSRLDQLPPEISAFLEGQEGERLLDRLHLTKRIFSGMVLLFVEDETHYRKRSQEEQLARLGKISSAIAHEIRNPLGTILQASQLLRHHCKTVKDEEGERLAAIVERGCRRLNQIVDNIYQIHSQASPSQERVELTLFLKRFARELPELLPQVEQVAFRLQLPKPPVVVSVDPSQLRQILLNLCQNGLEHGFNPQNPRLEIRLAERGERVVLDLVDFGKGVPESLRSRIFDPFVTTSPKGKGLGLYLARRLAAKNRIALQYLPNPEGGSIFRLIFRKEGDGQSGRNPGKLRSPEERSLAHARRKPG